MLRLPTSRMALKNSSKRHSFIRDMYSFHDISAAETPWLSPPHKETPKPTKQKNFLKIQIPKTQWKELTNQTKIPHGMYTNEIAKKKQQQHTFIKSR